MLWRMSSGARSEGPRKKAAVPVPGAGSNRRIVVGGVVGAVVVAAAVVGYVLLSGGSSSGGASAAEVTRQLEAAGCTVQAVKALKSNDHSVSSPGGSSKAWNTDPPTSGPHFSAPALWGAYTSPLNQAQVVHNLEHGGIFVQYGSEVPPATVKALQGFYDEQIGRAHV